MMLHFWGAVTALGLSFGLLQNGSIIVRIKGGPPPDPVTWLPTVVWTDLAEAGDPQTANGQQKILHDPVSGSTYQYGANKSGIYSNAVFFGKVVGDTYVQNLLSSSGGTSGCANYPNNGGGWNNGAGSPIQPWLSDRHPEFSTAIDTLRKDLCQSSGLACGGFPRDFWCMRLNVNTDDNRWRKIESASQTAGILFGGAMVYTDANDAFILHSGHSTGVIGGFPETYVLCPTQGQPLNAGHLAVGCVKSDVFTRVFDDDGTCKAPCTSSGYADMVYHSGKNRVYLFVLSSGTADVWTYHPTAKMWNRLASSNSPTNAGTDMVESVVVLATSGDWAGKMFYQRTCHNAFGGCSWVGTFMFDPDGNYGQGAWIELKTQGSGPSGGSFMAFAPNVGTHGGLLAYEPNARVWLRGVLQR